MVFNFWGLQESRWKKISFYLFLIALSGLLISLLDFRGEGERLKANIAQQKSVIMIDASASMLAEDVRPNRFEKSIFLARHFIRKASGHQVAVILFSDTHRKLVPFTSDLDLLDARLEALAKKSLSRGGTGLSLALQESINYLRDSEGKIQGNVLLYTDGEENQSFQDLKIPDEVNVAVVGVGTSGGGRIPMRSSRGDFQGYMRFGGKEIISKLDENSIRKIGENITNFKYWLVSSYSLPTENILSYFQSQYTELQKKGEVLIQPVKFHYIVVPSLLIWILAMLMGWGKQYIALGIIILFSFPAKPQSDQADNKKPQPFAEFDATKINKLLKEVKSGKAEAAESLILAEEILKSGRPKEALTLYQETNKPMMELTEQNKEVYFNWATSSLFADQKLLGLDKLSKLEDLEKSRDTINQEMLKKIRINRLLALRKESQKREEQKKKEQEQKKDKNKKGDQGEPQEQDDKGEEKESDQNKDGDKGQQEEKKDKGSGDDEKTADSQPKKPNDKKKDQKIPARLKELLGKDKQLQEQLLNTRTRERMRKDLKNW